MIEIYYNRQLHLIRVQGHAQQAPAGQDLVCAAATILARTAAECVQNARRAGFAKSATVRLSEGDAEISCRPTRRMEPVVRMQLDAICAGFELLADGAGQYARYTRSG